MRDELRDAESGIFTIPANGFVNFAYTGEFVRALSTTGELEISFNYGAKAFFEAGISRRVGGDFLEFQNFQLFNETATDITVKLAWGFGDIQDSRLQVSGDVAIKNAGAPNETISVDDGGSSITVDSAYFAWINTSLANIDKRMREEAGFLNSAPKTNLTNASFATVLNATLTLLTAALNINGVIIRNFAGVVSNTAGSGAALLIDGNIYGSKTGGGTFTQTTVYSFENLFIPAGVKVEITSNSVNYNGNVWYEVL